jgi:hypothetical protein
MPSKQCTWRPDNSLSLSFSPHSLFNGKDFMLLHVLITTLWLSIAWENHCERENRRQFAQAESRQSAFRNQTPDFTAPRLAIRTTSLDLQTAEYAIFAGPKPTPCLDPRGSFPLLPSSPQALGVHEWTCAICLESLKVTQPLTEPMHASPGLDDHQPSWLLISCLHPFHTACIKRWSQHANRCPLCAKPLWLEPPL